MTSNRSNSTFKAVINGPGVSCEQGHLYSDQACLGDGITAVCQSLLSKNKTPPISLLWSTVNGEHFSIKEIGVALIRYSKYFIQSYSHIHPAEYYGDCGAASGLLLMALAAQKAEFENKSGASLVLASSDKQNCAGVVVEW